MHYSYLQKKGKKRLLAIFADWGVDFRHFPRLKSQKCDILLIWNYRDLASNIMAGKEAFPYLETRVPKYKRVDVIAWSHGAVAAQWAFDGIGRTLCSCIAVNGMLNPLQGALPRYQTEIDELNEDTPAHVYAMMVEGVPEASVHFSKVSIDEWKEEIENLVKVGQNASLSPKWTLSVISQQNAMYPPELLQDMWEGIETELAEWPYYPQFQTLIDRYIDC